jgi:hypothetical protein
MLGLRHGPRVWLPLSNWIKFALYIQMINFQSRLRRFRCFVWRDVDCTDSSEATATCQSCSFKTLYTVAKDKAGFSLRRSYPKSKWIFVLLHTYIPLTLYARRGSRDISDILPNLYQKELVVRNTADVTSGMPITILSQSISVVSSVIPLVANYDIHGWIFSYYET